MHCQYFLSCTLCITFHVHVCIYQMPCHVHVRIYQIPCHAHVCIICIVMHVHMYVLYACMYLMPRPRIPAEILRHLRDVTFPEDDFFQVFFCRAAAGIWHHHCYLHTRKWM
jgi:hypothetical protein